MFGADPEPASVDQFGRIASNRKKYLINICRPILDEVRRHLLPQQVSGIYSYLNGLEVLLDERWSVPFEFAERYVQKGSKRPQDRLRPT